MAAREIRITNLGRSVDGASTLDKASFRVSISEGKENVVVEARISLGSLETLSDPEKRITEHFATGPLPKSGAVIDIY